MATIRTAIQIQDGMSGALRSMYKTISTVVSGFSQMQAVSGKAVDTASIRSAQAELNNLNGKLDEIETNINQAKNNQNGFNNKIREGNTAASGLGSTIGKVAALVGAAFSVKKIIEWSDSLATTKARLNMMNDGLQTTDELQTKIYQSAQRSRASYSDTANMVAKLGTQAKDAFGSNDEIIAFSEALNKSFAIAGADGQAVESVMYNLTQALASGTLRGQDLNAVFSNAPNIIENIADYLDVPIGKIREMAADGELSASVIKNAMLAAAGDINAQFEEMPTTIAQVWTNIKNSAMVAFQPVLEKINEVVNSEGFQQGVQNIINAMQQIAVVAMQIFEVLLGVINWASENMAWIEPIIIGVATAFIAWKVATLAQAAAQWVLNAAMNASPLGIIATVIGIVVAAVMALSNAVGGLGVLWQIIWTAIRTGIAYAAYGIMTAVYWIMGVLEQLGIIATIVWNALVTGLEYAGAGIAIALQTVVNVVVSALNIIIDAINAAFSWLWGSIDRIDMATFGDKAMESAQANAEARGAKVDAMKQDATTNKANRDQQLAGMLQNAQDTWGEGMAKADQMKKENQRAKDNAGDGDDIPLNLQDIKDNTGETAGSTDKMSKSIDMAEEDLKYLRDIAEREVINRFTTAEVSVNMGGVTNNVNSNTDLDGLVTYIAENLEETLATTAEGVHN